MKFILGTKENMTQYFTADGKVTPVTVVNAGPAVVTQVKTVATDGYNAVQIGFGARNKKNLGKALVGHFKDLGDFRYAKEFRLEGEPTFKVGDTLNVADVFAEGDKIVISGKSKGKGFQGVVKRHGFAGGRRSHGQRHSEREPGSIGAGGVQRVLKGTRMGGRMGGERVTYKNLKVVKVDKDNNLMLIKGAVPGVRGGLVEIVAAGEAK